MASMRRPKAGESFIFYLLLNLAINIYWSIPAWVLLALHFAVGLPAKWFAFALGLWFAVVLVRYLALCGLMRLGSDESRPARTPEEQAAHDERIREISRSVGSKNK